MKDAILLKASELFLTLGFKSVTMDDIASGMGISKKTIYQHFSNKHDLVEATTMHVFHIISEGIDFICNLNKPAIDELLAIKEFAMAKLNNEASSPFYQLQKYFPKVAAQLRKLQFDKVQTCIRHNLKKGIQSGLYRPNIDVEFTARLYFVGVTGIKDQEIFPETMYSVKEASEKYLDYHLHAIVTTAGLQILEKMTKKQYQS